MSIRRLLAACIATLACLSATPALAGTEGMPQMPTIHPKRTVTVSSQEQGDALQEDRGFGDRERGVAMMNLMMVEGSGYEGMDMAGMDMGASQPKPSTAPPKPQAVNGYRFELKPAVASKVGANDVTITVRKGAQPAKGLKPKAQVYMTSMDMGTDEPKVKEVAPGVYQLKAVYTMAGPWAVKLIMPDGTEHAFDVTVSK